MASLPLTTEAKTARREYLRSWNADNPEKVRQIKSRYWEKKAREFYGVDYKAPENETDLSDHARNVRKMYYKAYRKNHPDTVRRSIVNYWERKAKELNTTKEG